MDYISLDDIVDEVKSKPVVSEEVAKPVKKRRGRPKLSEEQKAENRRKRLEKEKLAEEALIGRKVAGGYDEFLTVYQEDKKTAAERRAEKKRYKEEKMRLKEEKRKKKEEYQNQLAGWLEKQDRVMERFNTVSKMIEDERARKEAKRLKKQKEFEGFVVDDFE